MDKIEECKQLQQENRILSRKLKRLETEVQSLSALHNQALLTRDLIAKEKDLQYEYNYLLLANMPDILFMLTPDLRFCLSSKVLANSLGYDNFNAFAGLTFREVYINRLGEKKIVELEALFRQVMESGEAVKYNDSVVSLSGEMLVLKVTISPAATSKGDILGVILSAIDTTELAQMKDAAEAASKAKSSFLASMSHEIRTPMNAIKGLSDLLWITELSSQQKMYVQNIKSACSSLLGIINDILDFSKIEANRYEIVEATYEPATMISEVARLMQPKAEEKGLFFIAEIAPELPTLLSGDANRIRQILVNIINNGIKFTQKGGVLLQVSVSDMDETHCTVSFAVRDTGIGIKEEEFQTIFKAFEQADYYKNRNIAGTGLGLAISKSLSELMGGSISVASEYTKGSTFTVRLPQKVEDPRPIVSVQAPERKRTLYFCDVREISDMLARMHQSLRVPMDTATSEAEFVDMLTRQSYTHVITTFDDDPEIISRHRNLLTGKTVASVKSVSVYAELKFPEWVHVILRPMLIMTLAALLNSEMEKQEQTANEDELSLRKVPSDLSVLVVDDNEINLLVAEEILKSYGIRPELADSGEKAIRLVREKRYELVFMDHMMPEMDGVESTRRIRALPSIHQPVIVALTANAIIGMEEMYLSSGFDDYISKPIEISALNRILKPFIG